MFSGRSRKHLCLSSPAQSCTPMIPKIKNTKKHKSSTFPSMGSVSRSSITRIRMPEKDKSGVSTIQTSAFTGHVRVFPLMSSVWDGRDNSKIQTFLLAHPSIRFPFAVPTFELPLENWGNLHDEERQTFKRDSNTQFNLAKCTASFHAATYSLPPGRPKHRCNLLITLTQPLSGRGAQSVFVRAQLLLWFLEATEIKFLRDMTIPSSMCAHLDESVSESVCVRV